MQEMSGGAMLAVALSEEEIQWMLGDRLSLAAINGPRLCVVSGPTDAVEELAANLGDGVWTKRLETSHAFHSAMMESMLQPFIEAMGRVKLQEPQIPFISNLTGTWIKAREATDPRYWADHLREAVRFADGVNELLKEPGRVLLEIGPGHALTTMVKRITGKASPALALHSLRNADEAGADRADVLAALGRLWLSGVKINWRGLHTGERRRREPLPTYPFERKRFWIEKPAAAPIENNGQSIIVIKQNIADWFYVPSWKRSPLGSQFDSASLASRPRIWVLMVDEGGVGGEIAARLEGARQQVIRVKAASQFEKLGDQSYAVNPRGEDDLRLLFDDVRREVGKPDRIIHLWNLARETDKARVEADGKGRPSEGFYSLLGLAQVLGESDPSQPVRLDIVINHAQDVLGDELIDPEKSPALAAAKVIPKEHANIKCKVIDVALTDSGTRERARRIEQLLAELIADDAESSVALRGNHRWAQTYEPVRMEASAEETMLKQGGVYLITGGTENAGLALAEFLVEEFNAKLVLTAPLNPLAQAGQSGTIEGPNEAERIERLRARTDAVLMVQADPASEPEMREAVNLAKQHFGALNGVIHAAGGEYAAAPEPWRGTLDGEFSAKAHGAQVLQNILKDENADFLVLCSSHGSLLGAAGRIDACAGDAYLDALARRDHAASDQRIVSINWDSWTNAAVGVDEINPAAVTDARPNYRCGEVIKRVLKSGLPQVIISAQDFQKIAQREVAMAGAELRDTINQNGDSGLKPSARRTAHPREDLSVAFVAPCTDVERTIAAIWGELLGVDEVGRSDNYFELGGDSIIALQIILRAKQAGLEFSPQDLFQRQTVAELAALVAQTPTAPVEPMPTAPSESHQLAATVDSHPADITEQANSTTSSPAPANYQRVKIDQQGLSGILKKINKAKK
jgi:acyl transferase domain-containing protein/acyl carrier protein